MLVNNVICDCNPTGLSFCNSDYSRSTLLGMYIYEMIPRIMPALISSSVMLPGDFSRTWAKVLLLEASPETLQALSSVYERRAESCRYSADVNGKRLALHHLRSGARQQNIKKTLV
jgi:hypothetical protein